ncbi:hypothetical protein ACMYSQ_008184 [Aspergillus niger]
MGGKGKKRAKVLPLLLNKTQLHRPMTTWFSSKIGGASATGLGEVQNTKRRYDAKVTRRESGRGELGANQQAAKASATVRSEKYDVATNMHGERKRIVLTIVVVRPGYSNYH